MLKECQTRQYLFAVALSQGTFSVARKIDASTFRHFDRLLTRQEREHLSRKDKSIYNTK